MRRAIVSILLVFVAGISIAVFMYHRLYVNQMRTAWITKTLNYVIDSKEHNDMIFVGSSRVWLFVNPAIIDSVTNRTSYCVALDGANIVIYRMLLRKYLQIHPKPKYVFMNVDFQCFNSDFEVYNYPDYYPYLKDTLIYDCLAPYYEKFRNRNTQFYYTVQKVFAAPDDDKIKSLIHGSTDFNSDLELYRGYRGSQDNWTEEVEKNLKRRDPAKFTDAGFNILQNCIDICKHDSIKLVFLYAPVYKECRNIITNYDTTIAKINTIAQKNDVPYFDFSNTPEIVNDKQYFYNVTHVNGKGSTIYSHLLANKIKSMMDEDAHK